MLLDTCKQLVTSAINDMLTILDGTLLITLDSQGAVTAFDIDMDS